MNVDELLLSQPDTGEQALEVTDMLVKSGSVDLIVIDSVAALTPRAEIEGDMGDHHMGLQARLMSQALRKITGNIQRSNCMVIFINQIRMKIGVIFGNPETTTGGNALKFYSSVRLDIRRIGAVKEGEEVVGNETVFLCAGWYATLATMLFESELIDVERIHSFDLDPSCQQIAETFNKPWYLDSWRFKATTGDIQDFNYTTVPAPSDGSVGNYYFKTNVNDREIETRLKPDTFINTSTEHIADFDSWYRGNIPFGSLVIMQGNNYHDLEEHVNTHESLRSFSDQCYMRTVLFEGELKLPEYTRYMKIGCK